jgi:hypothetical protein
VCPAVRQLGHLAWAELVQLRAWLRSPFLVPPGVMCRPQRERLGQRRRSARTLPSSPSYPCAPLTPDLTIAVWYRVMKKLERHERSLVAILGGLAIAVALACSSPTQPRYCHSINATTMNSMTFATERIACPTGATEFCDSVPISATSSSQAEAACNACFNGGCSDSLPCGGGAAGWYSAHDVATPAEPFISNGCFAYHAGVSGDFHCTTPEVRYTAGSIVAGAGDRTGCPTIPPSRWAP